ncbi:MAG: zinc-binding dehydrogenase [Armatimonadota bacterium]|nr:zinc-binding dehydrogenase [Armatimonadota bacterium]MDR7487146.1 zinc-binding dehydrogenase [Armatimonadota bacterium]
MSAAPGGMSGPIPDAGRAAVFAGPGRPFVHRTYPLGPPGPGEVLVRVRMATVCGSDLHSWGGRRPSPAPGVLGHEILGTVAALGPGVTCDLRGAPLGVGDRITWTMFIACGHCYYCRALDLPQKCTALRKYGHEGAEGVPALLGGFAEYCYVLAGTGIVRVPDEVVDEEATPLNCGVATMVAATEAAAITVGDTVIVQGLGLLGLYGVALARARGARMVIGLDTVPERLALGRQFGADLVIDVTGLDGADIVQRVRQACPPDGADAVLEVCGVPTVLAEGVQMLRKGGRYAVAGIVFPGAPVTLDANVLVARCLTVRGVHNYHPRHLLQAVDFVHRHRRTLPLGALVDARFSLAELDAAFVRAAERRVLRAAVVP